MSPTAINYAKVAPILSFANRIQSPKAEKPLRSNQYVNTDVPVALESPIVFAIDFDASLSDLTQHDLPEVEDPVHTID